MKRLILYLFPVLLFSCKENVIDRTVPEGMLYKVTLDDKTTETFEYERGFLKKETIFELCSSPVYIVNYHYESERILSVQRTSFMDASSSLRCGSKESWKIDYGIQYDDQGRISKITGQGFITYYQYDGLVRNTQVKNINSDSIVREYRCKLDEKGNLVEEETVGIQVFGGTMRYEYDDNPNPYYKIKSLPNLQVTAFNGPNNPVKAFDAGGKLIWEKKYTYNEDGFPLTRDEGHGYVYVYHYGDR